MMHGYLAFDSKEQLLVPFRTWRNTITEEAERILTENFNTIFRRDGVSLICINLFE